LLGLRGLRVGEYSFLNISTVAELNLVARFCCSSSMRVRLFTNLSCALSGSTTVRRRVTDDPFGVCCGQPTSSAKNILSLQLTGEPFESVPFITTASDTFTLAQTSLSAPHAPTLLSLLHDFTLLLVR